MAPAPPWPPRPRAGGASLGVDNSLAALAVCRKRLDPYHPILQVPLADSEALVDASAMPGIGFYTVSLNAYTLPANPLTPYHRSPAGLDIFGLDAVDQWYAGLLNRGCSPPMPRPSGRSRRRTCPGSWRCPCCGHGGHPDCGCAGPAQPLDRRPGGVRAVSGALPEFCAGNYSHEKAFFPL